MSPIKYYKSEEYGWVVKVGELETVKIDGKGVSVMEGSFRPLNSLFALDKTYIIATEADYLNALIPVKEFIDNQFLNGIDVTEDIVVDVVYYQAYRDGGTEEYRDKFDRRYFKWHTESIIYAGASRKEFEMLPKIKLNIIKSF